MIDFAATLDVFFGDANPAETRVYARFARDAEMADLQLAGSLTGPYCAYAQTLPATIALIDSGPGMTLLAQATVPDPCFWTPELPYLYRAKVELRRGQELLAACERPFGIRPLGARGRRFYYEGKPWVLRAVHGAGSHDELTACHELDAALFVDHPNDELCNLASELGVLLVADLSSHQPSIPSIVRRLARHAAVGLIAIGDELPYETQPRSWAPNVVFVQRIDAPNWSQRPWASALLCPADQIDDLVRETRLPVIAWRPTAISGAVVLRRSQCDALQRDLAGPHDIAGYIV